MVGGIDPHVVDGPVSWQAPLAIPRGRRKMDLFGFARPATVLVRGRPNKTMPVYGAESGTPTIAKSIKAKPQVDELSFCGKHEHG